MTDTEVQTELFRGASYGYLTTMILWFIPYPLFMLMIMSRASQESNYNPLARGDNGKSLGVLQFNEVNRQWWEGYGLNPDVPYEAGILAAKYVSDALTGNLTGSLWGILTAPYTWTSWVWTSGVSKQIDWAQATARAAAERLGQAAWAAWSMTAYAAIAVMAGVGVFVGWRAGSPRKGR